MAAVEVIASGFTFQVDAGGGYVTIDGINKFTLSQSDTKADTTVFTSGGNKKHLVTGREKTIKCDGLYYVDADTGARDAGQTAVEGLAALVGTSAVGRLKVTDPGGNASEFDGSFKLNDIGGGNDDGASWGFEFTRTGADVS